MSAPATQTDISAMMRAIGEKARVAYTQISDVPDGQKDMALVQAALIIRDSVDKILAANMQDIAYAKEKGLSEPMIDRLMLDEKRIEAMAATLETIATMPDPVNKVTDEWERPNGLVFQKVSIPLGVIGVIYESRPNVTADAAAMCIKSGNAVILRGGSESLHSSQAIVDCLREGLREAGLSEDVVQLVPVRDREAVGEMFTMIDSIDVIIPRGGKSLTERVMKESRVPTILHLTGNCHSYVHKDADVGMAKDVVLNAKMRRVGICGATESLLIDESAVKTHLPKLVEALVKSGCDIRGDEKAQAADARIQPASEEDWSTEYLAPMISIKVVKDTDEAIAHINRYGSHHTDAIITQDKNAARKFMRRVDSAIVLHNASTQFADGGEFGFGGEIGISTGRLHARGPVGAEQLTTYKYVVHGNGQTRE